MLDNALNACEDVDPGKRFVVFRASVKGSYLVLDMRNSKSTSEGDEGRETTRRGILDRIRFAEEQTSGGSLAEHGWGCPSSTRSCSATTGRFPLSVPRLGSACR